MSKAKQSRRRQMSKRPAPLAKSAPRASLLSRGSREHRKTATTGSSASHWALLSGRCVGMAVVALLLLALVSIAVYVISVHRLRGIGDVVTVLAVLRQETASDGRCKSHPKATAPSQAYRCLPNVFLIGASKSGTTSLTDYLAHHGSLRDNFVQRRIYDSDDGHREVHRFDRDTYAYSSALLEIGDEWASSPVVTDTVAPVFHYTPHYLYAPTVPFDLRRLYPPQASDALRFIVLLRNPVERALSSYWFHNSKLLNHRVDRGSIGDFIETARAEMRTRKLYDSCVRERLLGSDTAAAARAVDEAGGAGVLGVVAPLLRRASDALLEAALSLSGGAAPASGSGVAQKNATHFQGALYGCFGRESLRSSSLGHRHGEHTPLSYPSSYSSYCSFAPDQSTKASTTTNCIAGS